MIFTYDNTKVQYERNLPQGVDERANNMAKNADTKLQRGWVDSSVPPPDKGFKYDTPNPNGALPY